MRYHQNIKNPNKNLTLKKERGKTGSFWADIAQQTLHIGQELE